MLGMQGIIWYSHMIPKTFSAVHIVTDYIMEITNTLSKAERVRGIRMLRFSGDSNSVKPFPLAKLSPINEKGWQGRGRASEVVYGAGRLEKGI